MKKEVIHLCTGEIIMAEVNGITMDGRTGHVLLQGTSNVGDSLLTRLLASREIKVQRGANGDWYQKQAR